MTPDLLRRVAAVDPRGVALTLLDHLIETLGARGGAVFALRKGGLSPFAERTSLQGLGLAMKLWDENLEALAAGTKGVEGDLCILPVRVDGLLVGGVWLDGVDPRLADLGDMADLIAATIDAPALPLDHALDMETDEFAKRRTLMLLRDNEWNVARVSRIMKVTRKTIYDRLGRWGIERQIVRKGPSRRKRQAAAGA